MLRRRKRSQERRIGRVGRLQRAIGKVAFVAFAMRPLLAVIRSPPPCGNPYTSPARPMSWSRTPGEALSGSRAISAASFLRAVHAPCSRWNERDPRYHVRRPFFRSIFRAHAGIMGEHTALHDQRDVAPAKDRAFRQQPVDREVIL